MLKDIQAAQDASSALLSEFYQNPERYGNDLTSDASISFYYRFLYKKMYEELGTEAQDFPIPNRDDSIFKMLSDNLNQTQFLKNFQFFLNQSFQSAGQSFHVFDENTVDILVPYGEKGISLIADLCSARAEYDFNFVKETLEKAKPYTISLFQYQFKKLSEAHALYPVAGQRAIALDSNYYNLSTGLSMEPWTDQNMEVNICDIQIV